MTIKAVVFDLDGTITSFNLDYKAVRAEVRGYLIQSGVPASVLSTNESVFEMLKKTELFFSNGGKRSLLQEVKRKALSIAEKYELEAAANTSLLPGALETLKALKKNGLKVGICTINSSKSTEHILNRFKLNDYFDVTVTREKVNQVKPNSEHCQAVLEALGVAPSETIVIGDSVNDIIGAKQLKAVTVGLPTPFVEKDNFTKVGANYIVTSITDLPLLVQNINKTENAKV